MYCQGDKIKVIFCFGRYSGLLTMNDRSQENKQLLGQCAQDIRAVEGSLAKTYIEVSLTEPRWNPEINGSQAA